MEDPDFLPPSPVSPLSERASETNMPEKRISGNTKSYISCRTSTGIPRDSSITISSQSITVFADFKDLPSRHGSQRSKVEDENVSLEVDTPKPKIKRQSDESIKTISSFGFDVAAPEPVHKNCEILEKVYTDQKNLVLGYSPRQAFFQPVWGSKSGRKKQRSHYDTSPRPPSKALINFATVFPEIAHDKQPVSFEKSLPPPPYHVFEPGKKKGIMYLMALVGILTPLSSFIYFPVLGDISRAYHLSSEFVLLTIAVFMAVQGIAPLVWMPLGEYFGRRFALIATLAVYVGANAGLLFTKSFISLMLLRALQAFGSANFSMIGGAVIGDISTGQERGGFMGIYASILTFGHVISPVLGGILTQFFHFRAIFWFQLAIGGLALILVILFIPETLRNIAGNGTIRLKPYQQPLLSCIRSPPDARFDSSLEKITLPPTLTSFVEPLHLLSQLDMLGSIIFGAIAFATAVVVISTTALCLESYYSLSTILVGAAFLPSGAGTLLGFFVISFLLDRYYNTIESRYKAEHDIEKDSKLKFKHRSDFPIERARLGSMWWVTLLFIGATIGYGFSLSSKHIAVPLVMQFLVGFGATAILLANVVLISDLSPENLVSVTAIINLVRYCIGALAVGVVQLFFVRFDTRYTFLIFAMTTLVVTPILVIQWMFGLKWRMEEKNKSEDGTVLDRLKGLYGTKFPKRPPKWSDVRENFRTKVMAVKAKRRWAKVNPREDIGGDDAFLSGRSFRTQIPDWKYIWRRLTLKQQPGSS